ncbi:vomeronasal type-2 receptor 26-like [Bombina bombina]|uniref:vomeronasal type-2 receptor 26-like n=1 Tax=Bombina bombina TaxID=8345 RepID=UPI00235A5855|nr:vomeronasal type-2 receptor 26-like [Bombina bombina]
MKIRESPRAPAKAQLSGESNLLTETFVVNWKINKYLRKAHFTTASHEDISFTDYGDVPGHYDIINWIPSDIPEKLDPNKVGSFNSLAPVRKQIIVNDSAIVWSPKFKTTPTSVCNEKCAHGYRKVPWKEYPVCCYGCLACAEGEISNTTDAETCIKCPEDQWSNDERTLCIRKTVEFLSFEDTLGIVLTLVSVFCCIVTIAVLVIFFKHHTTPVVKANNQNLSYTLLLSLMLSFLCSLLFIGCPVQVSCLLRQVAFGIIFTVSVSSVLAKSVTVVIAFNATKPDSKIKKWVGTRESIHLVLLCSLGQTMICTLWLALYPPYPDYDTQSYIRKMILQCNEGSVTAFYLVIGYIGFLSTVSFFVAFLVRKLPASFNEAQMITFSMLVFCSVWISFIPTHLSTKGKYMVAVEIFAILASSAGLLGCIFIPKCYIILFKPELNTKLLVSLASIKVYMRINTGDVTFAVKGLDNKWRAIDSAGFAISIQVVLHLTICSLPIDADGFPPAMKMFIISAIKQAQAALPRSNKCKKSVLVLRSTSNECPDTGETVVLSDGEVSSDSEDSLPDVEPDNTSFLYKI